MAEIDPTLIDPLDAQAQLKAKTRLVPDFPKEGILFEDLTPVLADPELPGSRAGPGTRV